jgi:hypothetical protein
MNKNQDTLLCHSEPPQAAKNLVPSPTQNEGKSVLKEPLEIQGVI